MSFSVGLSDASYNNWPFKIKKVWERLKKHSRLKETKETGLLNPTHDSGLDPLLR